MPVLLSQTAQLLRLKQEIDDAKNDLVFIVDSLQLKPDELIQYFPQTSQEIEQSVLIQYLDNAGNTQSSQEALNDIKFNIISPIFNDKAVFFSDVINASSGNIECMKIQISEMIGKIESFQGVILEHQNSLKQLLALKQLEKARTALLNVNSNLAKIQAISPKIITFKQLLSKSEIGEALALLKEIKQEKLLLELESLKKFTDVDDNAMRVLLNNTISLKMATFLSESDRALLEDVLSINNNVYPYIEQEFVKQMQNFITYEIREIDELKYVIKKVSLAVEMLINNCEFCNIEVDKQEAYELSAMLNKSILATLKPDNLECKSLEYINELFFYKAAVELMCEYEYNVLEEELHIDLKIQAQELLSASEKCFEKLTEKLIEGLIDYVVNQYEYQNDVFTNTPINLEITIRQYTFRLDIERIREIIREPHFFEKFTELLIPQEEEIKVDSQQSKSLFAVGFCNILELLLYLDSLKFYFFTKQKIELLFDKLAQFVSEKLQIEECATLSLLEELLCQKEEERQFNFLKSSKSELKLIQTNVEEEMIISSEIYEVLFLSNIIYENLKISNQLSNELHSIILTFPEYISKQLINFEFISELLISNECYELTDEDSIGCQSEMPQNVINNFSEFLKAVCLILTSQFSEKLIECFTEEFEEEICQGIAKISKCTAVGREILKNDINAIVEGFEIYEVEINESFINVLIDAWSSENVMQLKQIYVSLLGWKKEVFKEMLIYSNVKLSRSQIREVLK